VRRLPAVDLNHSSAGLAVGCNAERHPLRTTACPGFFLAPTWIIIPTLAIMARPRSFSRRSADFQRPQFSEHVYDSLLDILSSTEPSLANVSGASPLLQGYLSRLTSASLSSVIQEHATLDEEKKDLDHQLNRLAKREYHSFVDTASHGDAIATAFDGFDGKVDRVRDAIPALDTAVAEFNAFAKSQLSEREKSKNLLSNHDRLLDILEMPSLVSTCVRNGYFSEAVQLSSHVKRLVTLHYTHVRLIQELAEQVESAMTQMTGRLISLLKEPLKLPSALKVVHRLVTI
jgi:conserved oligomeric Golgi complex subunit 8